MGASILEAFRRTWPNWLREAPRFSNVVTAALIVLIENGLTLWDMPRLLTDTEFREHCLAQVSEGSVAEICHDRCDRWRREAPLMPQTGSLAVLWSPVSRWRCVGDETVSSGL